MLSEWRRTTGSNRFIQACFQIFWTDNSSSSSVLWSFFNLVELCHVSIVTSAIFFVCLAVLLGAMRQQLWKLLKLRWGASLFHDYFDDLSPKNERNWKSGSSLFSVIYKFKRIILIYLFVLVTGWNHYVLSRCSS